MLALLVPSICHASEAELRDAYAAYQVAAEAGDLHAALPHAQRAYELGLEQYGPESRNTALLAFNYGFIQNEVLDFESAADTLAASVFAFDAAEDINSPALFDSLLELGRAHLGAYDALSAKDALSRALSLAELLFGDQSAQAGQAHYFLSFVPLFFELEPEEPSFDSGGINLDMGALYMSERPWLPYYMRERIESLRSGYNTEPLLELGAEHPAGEAHLEASQEIFESLPEQDALLAGAQLVEAAYLLEAGEGEHVDQMFRGALDRLITLQHVDEFLMRLAVTWINARHRRGWGIDEAAESIERVGQLAHLRREGEVLTLVRVPPMFPRSAMQASREGQVCLKFTISTNGRATDIEVYQSDEPRYFDRPSIEAIESFIYAPKMYDGHPIERENVRYCMDYQIVHAD